MTKNRYRVTEVELKQTEIIKPHYVIGMFVSIGHSMHDADLFTQQLRAQIRRRINQ